VAPRLGRRDAQVIAYRTRATDLLALGRRDSALAQLATAMRSADSLTGHTQELMRADIRLAQGQMIRRYDAREALPLLEEAATAYVRLGADSKSSTAMYETGSAARDAGDTTRARDWLVRAITQIERQQTTFQTSEGRAALFETADNTFDAMIGLEAAAGRFDSAFAYLERERDALRVGTVSSPPSLRAIAQRVPNDMLFVEYAVLRDQLIVWTASRTGTTHHVARITRDTIASLVMRFRREASIAEPRSGDARSQLFDILLRPLAAELRGVIQVAVVGDRELSGLPFAALWDGNSRRYAVEQYRVRTEPSGAFVLGALSTPRRPAVASTALVVGNPAFDSLEPLPGAAREANRIARFYPRPTLLTGPTAYRDTILSLLGYSRVFHFAGHAVFNSDQPELSYLALGSRRTQSASGTLSAGEIANLRLSNLELVVLSACRSVSSRTSRTGGVAGLASSFLRAGAPAIVSTLWEVSDDLTEPLLAGFHERFASGMAAPEALQRSQVEALNAHPGRKAAPSGWAAFIYTGP
jgi:CHAT domain-containing protein